MRFFKKRKNEEEQIKGGRNLIILGVGASAIALISTAISLKIYHDTGDVYLDRSRPGFISDDEKNDKEETDNTFSDSGELSVEDIEDYAKQIRDLRKKINAHGDDFTAESLSDEQLDIQIEAEKEEANEASSENTD